jgi:hypothetical protein
MTSQASPSIPPLRGRWIQGKVTNSDCAGLVTLIDIWDYTCPRCLQGLNHLRDWHECYAHLGLLILGVHASEFNFARKRKNVLRAVGASDISYPVLLDSTGAFQTDSSEHDCPSRYLYDIHGLLRFPPSGQAPGESLEEVIATLLQERAPGLYLAPVPTAADSGPEEQQDGPVTGTLHLGSRLGPSGSAVERADRPGPAAFAMPAVLSPDTVYLVGLWRREAQCSRYMGLDEGHVLVHYTAARAGLVMSAPSGARVYLLQDAKPLSREVYGEDVREQDGHAVVDVREPRLYRLVSNASRGPHFLSASSADRGLKVYAARFL